MAAPPFSEIDDDATDSVTPGAASSSVKVSVRLAGAVAPLPPADVAETVTDLSGASVALSFAVTVTVPELVVSPAAIVSVVAVLSVKSPAAAGATGAADTVTVVASLAARSSVAVTVATPPFSEIDDSDSDSDTTGLSSSMTVTVTATSFVTPPA